MREMSLESLIIIGLFFVLLIWLNTRCEHQWSNAWLRSQNHPDGGVRVWTCKQCGKVKRVHYPPIPQRKR
jgi:hypothetical protein